MNRRKFLLGTAGVGAAGVGAAGVGLSDKRIVEPEVRYKSAGDIYWRESIGGESVEFAIHYASEYDAHSVRALWRSFESPRKTYALAHRVTDEAFVESKYKNIVDFVKEHEKTRTLRIAMGSTIAKVKNLAHVSDIYAPMKPEGSTVSYI